ncbi:MAG: caspase family protein [Verrucomicrobiae bacterium]|nr:caspase family protein [Verrucomicrobiae bacterium]
MAIVETSAGSPATHALIIGVNEYPHLPDGAHADATILNTLKQLTSPVPSASLFANWFLDERAKLAVPFGSARVLLSGGRFERSDGSVIAVDTPSFANIKKHFNEWINSCNEHKNGVALLYFCGHGFIGESSYILPEDVGSDSSTPWENCIDLNSTHKGMARCRAETQCFFIDACQDLARGALLTSGPFGRTLLAPERGFTPVRDAPIYHSAAVGQRATSQKNLPSDFTVGLIECLTRYGASANHGRNPHKVTTGSLRMALGEYLDRRGQSQAPVMAFSMESTTSDKRICTIQEPEVLTNLDVGGDLNEIDNCVFTNRRSQEAHNVCHPYRHVFAIGDYDVVVTMKSPPVRAKEDERLVPPVYPVEVF